MHGYVAAQLHSNTALHSMLLHSCKVTLHFAQARPTMPCIRSSNNWGEPERSPTLLGSMHSAVYIYIYIYIYISIRTTSDKVRMRQMFHVKHGVGAPPTTCMRSPKRKGLRNRCSYRYQRVLNHRSSIYTR